MIIVEQTTDSVAAQVLGPEGRGFFSVELTGATLMAAAVATPAALAADPRVELWPQVRSARRFLTTSTAFSPECGKQDKRASRRSRSRAFGSAFRAGPRFFEVAAPDLQDFQKGSPDFDCQGCRSTSRDFAGSFRANSAFQCGFQRCLDVFRTLGRLEELSGLSEVSGRLVGT